MHAPSLSVPLQRRSLPLRPLRLLAALCVLVALGAGSWMLLRDSGLVAVQEVEVSGASGNQRVQIRRALETAGLDMTTLHVRPDVLRTAVAPYAIVKSVQAEADFPHALRIRVEQHVPVATVVTPAGSIPVAADGTLLKGSEVAGLPALTSKLPPAGDRISDEPALAAVQLLARAPAPLRAKVDSAFLGPRGLVVRLAAGPTVAFGAGVRLRAKWASLTAVLASPEAKGATTIDVRVPEHPAAGGLEQASVQQGQPSGGG